MRISGYDEDNLSQSLGKFMIKDVQQIKEKVFRCDHMPKENFTIGI